MELRYYRYTYPSFLGQNGLDFYWKTHFSVWIFISFRFVVIDIHKIINHPNYYIIHIENQSIYFSLLYQGLKSPWLTALEKPRNKAFLWCPKKSCGQVDANWHQSWKGWVSCYQKESKHDWESYLIIVVFIETKSYVLQFSNFLIHKYM